MLSFLAVQTFNYCMFMKWVYLLVWVATSFISGSVSHFGDYASYSLLLNA